MRRRRVLRRQAARQDLVDHFVFIGQDNLDAAHRFLAAADRAFAQLAEMPEMGSPRHFQDPRLAGMRAWLVPGFHRYVIYYRPISRGIEVLRVLHSARDVRRIFGE